MMSLVIAFCVILVVSGAFSHMPTVYEFCSHVVANGEGGRTICDARHCQGRPGKTGPNGPRGIPGFKGEKGDQGTSEGLEEKVENLEESIARLRILLKKQDPTREVLCSMGMKNNDIEGSALSASTSYDGNHAPKYGRLDFRSKPGSPPVSAWCARNNRVGEWYQVDFGTSKSIAGIITQGRFDAEQWVTSFKVQCGSTIGSLETIRDNGRDKVFAGNYDRNTKVISKFPELISCRYLRVYPQSWRGHMSMKMEFIRGECYDLY